MLMMLVRAGSLIREVRGGKTLPIQPVQWLRRKRQRRRDPAPLRFTGDVGRTLTLRRGSGAPRLNMSQVNCVRSWQGSYRGGVQNWACGK
jgi:hypothetical protein